MHAYGCVEIGRVSKEFNPLRKFVWAERSSAVAAKYFNFTWKTQLIRIFIKLISLM